uniref:Nicotinate phosphoribosyltransferase n=1 Tax=Spongospora subterranea TaxID=70186 RepID=A0A0H5RL88_9EUKA|eukprot:CRZ09484.1 hypothetical protein [Spongospora subterranea]
MLLPPPTSSFVRPLLTDYYQISMAYAYWRAGRHMDYAVFDLFFRSNPFNGQYTIFAGLEEVLRFVSNFAFSEEDLRTIKSINPHFEPEFLKFLSELNTDALKIYAIDEGTVVFPRIPLIRIEGPLALAQLMETTFLVLVNYASLITTNAARHRVIVGDFRQLLEFGLRRAQGPDGGVSASRYAYMGGFNATSNVLAGQLFNLTVRGTHAHSFVSSFTSLHELPSTTIKSASGKTMEFVELCLKYRDLLGSSSNLSELAAFICFAQAFSSGFLALIDTYNVLTSGLPNFLSVALALHDAGFRAIGIRLDSGDLAYYSNVCRQKFEEISKKFTVPFENLTIIASSDINEDVLQALALEGHSIDCFGVGTHLVTCQKQPALGCVFKLVEVKNRPRIKVSADLAKMTIPGRKAVYRLFNAVGEPILDLLSDAAEPPPQSGVKIRCNHPIESQKRCDVVASTVKPLLHLYWDRGEVMRPLQPLLQVRERVQEQVKSLRADHVRYLNPTPYKVSLTTHLFTNMQSLWLDETPVATIQ